MAPHVETIPRAFVTRLCEIVVEATHMRMDRENLMETLDIDQNELDDVIRFAKQHNGV